jgi:phytol kinase
MVAYQVLGVFLWVGLVLLAAELVARLSDSGKEISRKIVHIGVGNVILLAWWFRIPTWVGIGAAIAAGGLTLITYRYPILASVSGIGRKSWGTFFYAISIGLLIAYFWPLGLQAHAVLGVLIMTWGDGLAALIGQRWGDHPYQMNGLTKSWEGTLTMLVASVVVSSAILGTTYGWSWPMLGVAAMVAFLATALETFSMFGIDNLTVPLGSAFASYGLIHLWLG